MHANFAYGNKSILMFLGIPLNFTKAALSVCLAGSNPTHYSNFSDTFYYCQLSHLDLDNWTDKHSHFYYWTHKHSHFYYWTDKHSHFCKFAGITLISDPY